MKMLPALPLILVLTPACGSNGSACVPSVPSTRLVEIACTDGPQGICFAEYDSGF